MINSRFKDFKKQTGNSSRDNKKYDKKLMKNI